MTQQHDFEDLVLAGGSGVGRVPPRGPTPTPRPTVAAVRPTTIQEDVASLGRARRRFIRSRQPVLPFDTEQLIRKTLNFRESERAQTKSRLAVALRDGQFRFAADDPVTRDLAGPFLTDADRRQVLAEADFPEEMVDALLRDLDIVANPFHPSFFQTLNFVVSPLTFLGETIKFGAGIVVGGGLELASGRLPSIGETQERFEELPLAAQIASEFVLTAPFFSVKLATGITRFGTTTAKFGAKQLVAPSRRIGTLARPVVVSEQGSFRIAGRAPHVPPSPVTDALIELPELGKLADAVTTSENRLVRTLFGQTGLVPSILRTTPVGRIMVGNARMAIVSENILQAEIAARLVTHLQGVRGGARALMKIDEDGFVEGTGKLWQDVFGNPGAYKLNEGQRAFIRDFNVYIKGLEDMKVTAGLRKEGLFDVGGIIYVPRKAVAIEIIDKTGKKVTTKRFELPSQSNSKLRRVHDSATEGHGRGTIYHNDPLATAELHGRQTLREISNKKLSEALAPHGITGKELLPKAIVSEATAAAVAVSKQLIDIRAVTRQIATSERALLAAKKVLGERKRFEGILSEQRRAMSKFVRPKKGRRLPPRETLEPGLLLSAQARLDASLRHLDDLRLLRGSLQDDLGGMTKRLDRGKRALKDERDVLASRRQKAPGRLFGRSDEFITVKMWNGGPGANRFYPLDEIKFLEEGIRSVSGGRVVEGFTRAANALRTGVAVFDFALAGIQGLPVLVTNPKAWSRMFMKNVQGTYDPSTFARMTAHFRDEVRWLAENGVPLGDIEFFLGAETGKGISLKFLDAMPAGKNLRLFLREGGKQTFGRFQQGYNAGLLAARVHLLRGLRGTMPDDELARFIRNLTGGLDSRAIGVGPVQQTIESTLGAFSPRLLRSTIALVGQAANPSTPGGQRALNSIMSLFGGVTMVYVSAGLALGKDWDEILEGLNPLNGKKFLSYEFDGDWIGFGTPMRSLTQFAAEMYSTLAPGGKPLSDVWSTRLLTNPFGKWWISRGPPLVTLLRGPLELATKGNIDLSPFDEVLNVRDIFENLGKDSLPFIGQAALEGQNAATLIASALGARTSPETGGEVLSRLAAAQGYPSFAEAPPVVKAQIRTTEEGLKAAEGMRDRIERQRVDEELALWDELSSGIITKREFINGYFSIQAADAERRGDEFESIRPKDDNQLARQEYFQAFQDATLASGALDGDALEANLTIAEAGWTAEQKQFVENNIGTRFHPAGVQDFAEFRRKLREVAWWDQVGKAPAMLARPQWQRDFYVEGLKAQRAGGRAFDDLIKERSLHPALEQRLRDVWSDMSRDIKFARRLIRFENPELDFQMVNWGSASSPVRRDTAARMVREILKPGSELQAMMQQPGEGIKDEERARLRAAAQDAGKTPLQYLVDTSPAILAKVVFLSRQPTVLRRKANEIRFWDWAGQARALLAALQEQEAA